MVLLSLIAMVSPAVGAAGKPSFKVSALGSAKSAPVQSSGRPRSAAEPGSARLEVIKPGQKLPFGAAGRPGDYLLTNGRTTYIISSLDHPAGNAVSGGYVIDAYPVGGTSDAIGQLHLYLNDQYPRMAKFSKVTVASPSGKAVSIVFTGVDSYDAANAITTTYTLSADSASLDITTAYTLAGHDLPSFSVGDAFAWGQAQQFVPGDGFGANSRFTGPWIGGSAPGVAYGYYVPEKPTLSGRTGSTWANPIVTSAPLSSGATMTAHRRLVAGHDLADVLASISDETNQLTYPLDVSVTQQVSNDAAQGVAIELLDNGKPRSHAVINGSRTLQLPAGLWSFVVRDRLRSYVGTTVTRQLPGQRGIPVTMQVTTPAALQVNLTDAASGKAIPGRIRLFGRNGTPDPDLGPVQERRARNTAYVVTDADKSFKVPAGDYEIVASRGIEYDMVTGTLTLKPAEASRVDIALPYVGFAFSGVRADFHLHMKNSFDSAIPLEDRVISCVGEGLDFIVSTDHNYITDLKPVIQQLGLTKVVSSVIGNEITTRKHFFGHFIGFPMVEQVGKPGAGATAYEGVTAAQLIAAAKEMPGEQVIQINHPRSGDIGYFNRVRMSPEDGLTTHPNWCDQFTAIEVFNGKRTDEVEESLTDWLHLIDAGYNFCATGNSDSHKVFEQEPGYPRNYVALPKAGLTGKDLETAVVQAVNERQAVMVTNGPLLSVDTVKATKAAVASTGPLVVKFAEKPRFQVKVLGANFVQPNKLTVWSNGAKVKEIAIVPTAASLKHEETVELDGLGSGKDAYVVFQVSGDVSMEPILTSFVEGKLNIAPTPLAFTNPIYVDVDGDGKFSAPRPDIGKVLREDRSALALSQLDKLTSQSVARDTNRRRRSPGRTGEN